MLREPIDSDSQLDAYAIAAESDMELRVAGAHPLAQEAQYRTLFDRIPQGVCCFDAEGRLILCNRRYAEMYRLAPEQARPGVTLAEITERRAAVGTCPMAADDYLSWCAAVHSASEPSDWTAALQDGRIIHMRYQPTPDGGWLSTHDDVTELLRSPTAANERVSLQTLIDWVPDNLWVKDTKSRFVIANKATALRMGFARPEDLIGKTDLELCPPERAREYFSDEQRVIQSAQPMIDQEELTPLDEKTWISTTKVPLLDDKNQVFGLVGVSRDITERRQADRLRDSQAEILEMIAASAPLQSVLDRLVRHVAYQLTHGIGCHRLLDEDGRRQRHGAAPSLPEGYWRLIDGTPIGPRAGSCGTAAYRREAVVVADIMQDPLWQDLRDSAAAYGYRSCWSTPIMSHQKQVLGAFALYSGSVREPTEGETRLLHIANRIAGIAIERKRAEDRIHFMATHDALTGLPNRSLLDDRLSQAIFYAERYDRGVVVMFVDLDNFKLVNDSLGHKAGDDLLKQISGRMTACLRATDTVMRLGGDEFVIVLFDQPNGVENVSALLQTFRAAIAEPLEIEGNTLRVTGSIGVASYPNDGTDAQTLLANADAAMYRAKQIGRDNFQFYTPDLNTKAHEKLSLQEELRKAVACREFVLVYQPQADLRTGRIFAVEALIRWMHPVHGLMSPARFIPAAEETGLIVPIGKWALREACSQNKAWQDAGLPPVTVCVNVSTRQFEDKTLVANVVEALEHSGLEARYLELEVTESLIMQNVGVAVATMKELQSLGIQLSIDDFGTGYSSLSVLRTFPVVRLKIDKSFIADLATNEDDRAIAKAVIYLGQKLKLKVIAEGVETDEQLAFLRENDCDEMQGFHLSKPLGAAEIERLMKRSSTQSSATAVSARPRV